MRIQHVNQATKSWPDVFADDRRMGTDLVEIIDRLRWRLWHGQVARALDLIGETLITLDGVANGEKLAAAAARKVARLFTESTVQWLLHRRMNAQKHVRWSPRGAHLMLKVRTATANGTLERDHAVSERWGRRPFRRAA
jgi:hypothetical protein